MRVRDGSATLVPPPHRPAPTAMVPTVRPGGPSFLARAASRAARSVPKLAMGHKVIQC
jgi:hypothetical protein